MAAFYFPLRLRPSQPFFRLLVGPSPTENVEESVARLVLPVVETCVAERCKDNESKQESYARHPSGLILLVSLAQAEGHRCREL